MTTLAAVNPALPTLLTDDLAGCVAPFLLTLVRLGGLFIFAPVLSSSMIPLRAKAILLMALTLAVFPFVSTTGIAQIELDLAFLAPAIVAESLIGLTLGLLAAAPMYAAQIAGLLTSQQAGLGLASIYNPALETETDIVGQLFLLLGTGVFILLGGLEALVGAIAGSLQTIPLAGVLALDRFNPLDLLIAVTTSGFELALRLSLPVLAIITLETLAASVLMKTIPQMNILTVGFAVKVILMLLALILAIGSISDALTIDMADTLARALDWLRELAPGPLSTRTPYPAGR